MQLRASVFALALALLGASSSASAQPSEPPAAPSVELTVARAQSGAAPVLVADETLTCTMPCRLPLAPGPHRFAVAGLFSQTLTVPSANARLAWYAPDPAGVRVGAALVTVGAVPFGLLALPSFVAAMVLFSSGSNHAWSSEWIHNVGGVVLAISAGLAAVSVPLLVVGSRRILDSAPRISVRRDASALGVRLDLSSGAPVLRF